MYKIIACDLDETLLNDNHQISVKDIESIRKATELGVKFVIATGRPFNSAFNDLKRLGLFDKEDEYVISFNGSALTENKGNRVIYRQEMPFDKINELYKKGVEYDTCIHGCRYCYANASLEKARQGFEGHVPQSSVVTGCLSGDEKITIHE